MSKMIDITNQKFGRLIVIAPSKPPKTTKNQGQFWLCKCDCGKTAVVFGTFLRSGHTKSCGCLRKERTIETNTKHGMKNTKLYHVYIEMKQRCYNERNKNYKNYGGRGIKICSEWLGANGFVNFYNWAILHGYLEGTSIDRIDVDRGYSPDNCRWANASIQGFNKRLSFKNTTGHKGIYKTSSGKYVSKIKVKQKQIHIGTFNTFEEALEAREKEESKYFPECT